MSEESGYYGNRNAAKPAAERKSASIQLYCTHDRKAELQEKAKAAGIGLSAWILSMLEKAEADK